MQAIHQTIQLNFNYTVFTSAHVFALANPLLRDIIAVDTEDVASKVLFLIDNGVYQNHPTLIEAIQAYCQEHADVLQSVTTPLVMRGSEAAKNTSVYVEKIYSLLQEFGLCRHSYVVAIGGGAFIDMAGFASATAHRGVRLIRIPTTVLAQCDAAIGIKNSINKFGKKNFIGTFAIPHAVINDSEFLTTLSSRDWTAGMAEAVKVALIKDADFFRFIEQHAYQLTRRDMANMKKLIFRCAELHLRHIASAGDPFERGSARPLDFGHWAAHKLEQLTENELRHGEAVAIGIALDTTYAYLTGALSETVWRRILYLLNNLGFILYSPALSVQPEQLLTGLREFQEHLGGQLTLTLISDIGESFEVHAMDANTVIESIKIIESRYYNSPLGDPLWLSKVNAH